MKQLKQKERFVVFIKTKIAGKTSNQWKKKNHLKNKQIALPFKTPANSTTKQRENPTEKKNIETLN